MGSARCINIHARKIVEAASRRRLLRPDGHAAYVLILRVCVCDLSATVFCFAYRLCFACRCSLPSTVRPPPPSTPRPPARTPRPASSTTPRLTPTTRPTTPPPTTTGCAPATTGTTSTTARKFLHRSNERLVDVIAVALCV